LTQKAEIKIFDGVIYKENDKVVTYVDTNDKERPLLRMTPGVLFAHHNDGHDGGGGHGHALKEPLFCNVASKEQKCFEWPGKMYKTFLDQIKVFKFDVYIHERKYTK
jgi:hypothetical protein